MRKSFVAIISVIMSLLMGVSLFSGCDLITNNNERDLNQVVATVDIGDGFETEKIYKKDMITGYMNYGYYYAQSYGQAEIFNMIIDTLINNRILVQHAMKQLASSITGATVGNLESYLTDLEKTDAKYEAIKSINDLIDSYEEAKADLKVDTFAGEVRTTPTDAAKEEKKLTDTEKPEYVTAGIDDGEQLGDPRNVAYNKVLKVLKNNGLLGEGVTDIANSSYYDDLIKGQMETKLIEKFENTIKAEKRAEITFDVLSQKYAQMYLDQQNSYQGNDEALKEALSSASAKSPIIYNGSGSYGYVYNLLLGVTAEQTAAIEAIETTDTTEYISQRNNVLQATMVKDLRSSWILSGYDFDGQKFTGDYTYATDPDDSLAFEGTVTEIAPKTDDENAVYRIDSVREFGLNDFIAYMDNYLYGTYQNGESGSGAIYKKVDIDSRSSGVSKKVYEEKINEL
ncbi:MAG: hypothetical protein E7369_04015, partial [Clostridiales bacterium]|nr:hypothetical protein [Clostridiales bacterium]